VVADSARTETEAVVGQKVNYMPKNRNVKPSVRRNGSRVKYLVSNQLMVSKASSASRRLISVPSVGTTPSLSTSYIGCVLPELLD